MISGFAFSAYKEDAIDGTEAENKSKNEALVNSTGLLWYQNGRGFMLTLQRPFKNARRAFMLHPFSPSRCKM